MRSTKLVSSHSQYSSIVPIYVFQTRINGSEWQTNANLAEVIAPVSGIEKELSKVIHLSEGIRINIHVRERKQRDQKAQTGQRFPNHGPHLHLSQTTFTSEGHLVLLQSVDTPLRRTAEISLD